MAEPTRVFISYASDMNAFARQLNETLTQRGIDVWVDFACLKPGHHWIEEMRTAMQRADWFIFLMGPESMASQWLDLEWRESLSAVWAGSGKRMLPVLFGDITPPPFLQTWVALRVPVHPPDATWTLQVFNALNDHGDRTVKRDRSIHLRRLEELKQAVEAMRAQAGDLRPVGALSEPFTK